MTKTMKDNKIKTVLPRSPPRISLEGINKTSSPSSSTPPTREIGKKIYSAENFPWFYVFLNSFMMNHTDSEAFLGENPMQNFRQILEEKFFEWLNFRQNSQKNDYVIKKIFMTIAEAVLFLELANHQRRLTPFGFVVGPFQYYLDQISKGNEPINFEAIPYSKSLIPPPIATIDNIHHLMRNDKMKLNRAKASVDIDDYEGFDVSPFLA